MITLHVTCCACVCRLHSSAAVGHCRVCICVRFNRLILQTNRRHNVIVVIMRAQSNLKTIPDKRRCNSVINKLYSYIYIYARWLWKPSEFIYAYGTSDYCVFDNEYGTMIQTNRIRFVYNFYRRSRRSVGLFIIITCIFKLIL